MSPCAATGRAVRLVVAPDAVTAVVPTDAVVSVAVSDTATCDVRSAFCNQVHFFVSREAAHDWSDAHPNGAVLSVVEAFALGRSLGERLMDPDHVSCC